MAVGQVLITFDDGMTIHKEAADVLQKHNLRGTFGVTGRMNEPGHLTEGNLKDMAEAGHFICNHSWHHLWSGVGADKPGLSPAGEGDDLETALTADLDCMKDRLNALGHHGDYVLLPFGTSNMIGPGHYRKLLDAGYKWIRLTIGTPLSPANGDWTMDGGKRFFPHGWNRPLIGITVAADSRRPMEIIHKLNEAAKLGVLCVLAYHNVASTVGEEQSITWEQFNTDMNHLADLVRKEQLTVVSPDELIGPGV